MQSPHYYVMLLLRRNAWKMMCNIIFVVEPHRQRHLIIHTHSYYFSWHNILDIVDHEAIWNNYATEWNIYTTEH